MPGSLARCATWIARSATAACRCSAQLGVSFERYGEGWAEAAWTTHRARGQPVRHRARWRLRRGPRRGDELRRQQRARVGRPGRDARRVVPDPPAPKVGRRARGARRGRAAHPAGRLRRVDGDRRRRRRSCRAAMATFIVRRKPAVTDAPTSSAAPPTRRRRGRCSRRIRRGWILEILVGVAIYLAYDWLRDQTTGTSADAYRHAQQIIDAEKFLGLYHEYSIQQAFLDARLVHVVLEHLVRHHPLRDAGGRAGVALPQGTGEVRALAQHARVHARRRRSSCSGRIRSCRRG